MLTATSAPENLSIPPTVVRGAQPSANEASPERWREFDDILTHAIPHFRQIAMRKLRNREDAEDAVQEALLSAFRHIAHFDGRAKMSTWLTTIVLNAVRMQIRARPRVRMVPLDSTTAEGKPAMLDRLVDPGPSPEEAFEQAEARRILTSLTCSLPSSQRAALRLRRRGFSIRQAAKALRVPEGTLKARLARGRAKLVEKFHCVLGRANSQTSAFASRAKRRAPSSAYHYDRTQLAEPLIVVFAQEGGSQGWTEI